MATRHELIHIDFVANAGKANPVLQSLKDSCEEARIAKEKLDNELTSAKAANAPKDVIEKINKDLIEQTKIYQALQKGVREYAKGIDTLSKGIKEYNEGTLDQMSPKFNKALANSAKLAQSNFKSNTKEWSDLQTVIEAAQRNVTRAREDIDGLMQSMKTGASVSANQLTTARDVLKDLADLAVVGSEDWRGLQKQMNEVAQAAVTVAETERRLKGEIVDEQDAIRLSNTLTKEAIAQRHAMGEAFVQAAQKERSGIEESMKGVSQKMVLERQEREELKDTIELQENYDKLIEKRDKKIADAEGRKQEAEKRKAEAQATINAYDEQEKKIQKLKAEKKDLEEQQKKETQAAEKAAKSTKDQGDVTEGLTKKVSTLKGEIGGLDTELKELDAQIENLNKTQGLRNENPIIEGVKEGAKDAQQEILKLAQLQEELKQATAGYKRDASQLDLMEILNRSAQTRFGKEQGTSTTWHGRFENDASLKDTVNGLAKTMSKDNAYWISTAKEQIKNRVGSFLNEDKSLADLKAFREEWSKVVQSLYDEGKGSGNHMEAIRYIDNLIEKTEQLKNIQEKRAAVQKQQAVVDGLKKESAAIEETTAAKKEEVKTEGAVIKTTETETVTVESLMKANDKLKERLAVLYEEERKLSEAKEHGTEAVKEETNAIKEEANAFKELSKEQAQAMLDAKQKLATFSTANGKTTTTNLEEAQSFIFEAAKKISPSGTKGGNVTLEGEKQIVDLVSQFQSHYGLQSADEAQGIIKSVLGDGGLIKKGFMNKFILNIEQDTPKVAAYNKEIKDLTTVISGEVETIKEESRAVEENAEKKRTLEQVQAEIKQIEDESRAISKQTYILQGQAREATEADTQSLEENTEAKRKNIEVTKAAILAAKDMTAEEAKLVKDDLTAISTVGWKAGKVDMSNPDEVQNFLIAAMGGKKLIGEDGTLSVKGSKVESILGEFQKRYGFEGDRQTAKEILKEIVNGRDGGLFNPGGAVDFNAEKLSIKVDKEAFDTRIQLVQALTKVTNAAAEAEAKVVEATKKDTEATKEATKATEGETDAIAEQIQELNRRKSAYDKANDDYEAAKAELTKKRSRLSRLPKTGADALLQRDQLQGEIDEYNDTTVKPLRKEAGRLKKLWEQYKESASAEGEATEKTKKRTRATEEQTKATEEAVKAEMTMEEMLAKRAEIESQLEAKKKKLGEAQTTLNELQQQSIAGDKAEANSTAELLKKKEEEYNQATADLAGMKEGKAKAKRTIRSADRTIASADETISTTKNEALPQRMSEAEVGKMKKRVAELDEEIKKDTQDFDELAQKIAAVNKRETDAAIEMAQSENVSMEKVKQAIDLLKEKIRTEATDEQTMQARGEAINRLTERYTQMNAEVVKLSKPIADRLSAEDFGKMSETEIRQGIDAANQLIKTYESGSDEAKRLAENIVRAEKHIRENGVEAARQAQQQKDAIELMQNQLSKGSALTESALKTQVKYWQQLADDPKTAAESVKVYTDNLKEAQELLKQKSEADIRDKAGRLQNMDNYSVSELKEGIEAAKVMQQTFRLSDDEVKKLSEDIVAAETRINKVSVETERAAQKQRESIELMQNQLNSGAELTESALKAQVKYWQQLADDPKTAAESVKVYTDNLKEAQELLKQKNEADIRDKAGRLQNMDVYSVSELKEGIEAAKQMQQTFHLTDDEVKKLSEDIVKAEVRISKVSVETERAAQREREAIQQMEKQLAGLTTKMSQHEDVSLDVLKAQHNYWQKLINDPKNAGQSLQKYEANLAEVERLQRRMVGKMGQEAFEWFERGDDANASANDIKERTDAMKAWRDTLPKQDKAEVIAKIDEYLQKTGRSAKKAAEDMMSLDEALELAKKAGENYYLSGGKEGFVASPQQIQAATKAIEQERDALIKTIQSKKANGDATKEEEKKLANLTKKLKDLKFEQDNLNMSQEKMQMLMKQPTQAVNLDELRSAIKRADGELKRMEGSMGKNSKQYKEFAAEVKNAKNVLKEMEGQAKATSSAWDKAWSRLKTYVGMYMGFNALWNKITGTFSDIHELSDRMGEVRKTTGFTADEVGRLSDKLAELDTRTGLTNLMSISAKAGQLGLKNMEDVIGFTEAANKLMVALPEMGEEAATQMMKVAIATGEVNKIQKEMDEGVTEGSSATAVALERIGSTIDQLRANSAAAAPQITDFVKRVGAVGAQSNISIDQVAALGSTVDALGMRVEMSATALSRMIPAIKRNAFEVAKAIGMAPNALRQMFDEAGGGMNAMLAIFQHIKDAGMNADDIEKMMGMGGMADIMKDLNQQGARAGIVFAGLSQNVDELRRQLGVAKTAYEENIAIQNEYDKMNETTAAKWERLSNKIEEIFVSDTSQNALGVIIDGLRTIIDLITGPLSTAFNTTVLAVTAIKTGLTEIPSKIGGFFDYLKESAMKAGEELQKAANSTGDIAKAAEGIEGAGDAVSDISEALGDAQEAGEQAGEAMETATGAIEGMTGATRVSIFSVQGLKTAWKGLDTTMKANIIVAVVALLYTLGKALYNALTETSKYSKAVADANAMIQIAIDRFEGYWEKLKETAAALDRAKKSTEGLKEGSDQLTKATIDLTKADNAHKAAIADINSIYGKYLGFMLTEANYANLSAAAHDKVAAAIRREMLAKQQQAAIDQVTQENTENLKDGLANLTEELREDGRLNNQEAAKAKSAVQKFMRENIKFNTASGEYEVSQQAYQYLTGKGANLGKLKGLNPNQLAAGWLYEYLKENFHLNDAALADITGVFPQGGSYRKTNVGGRNFRGDYASAYLDNMQDVAEVQDVFAGDLGDAQKEDRKATTKLVEKLKKQADAAKAKITDKSTSEKERNAAYEDLANALEGLDGNIDQLNPVENKTLIDAVKKQADDISKSVDKDKLLRARTNARSIFARATGSENGYTPEVPLTPESNPWGTKQGAYSTDWAKMTAEQLVQRRKQMKDFVNSIQTDTDVKAVLEEDAALKKAIEKGMSSDMRTVIEWYNTQRLKIQDELHARHLTNTGDWLDPKKGAGNWRKMVQNDFDTYLRVLDAYYTERKAEIEKAQAEEGLSEAEAQRLTIENETVWRKHRIELQQIYQGKSEKIAKEERQRIYDILAEQDEDSAEFVEKTIMKSIDKMKILEGKSEVEFRKIMSKITKDISTDFYKQQNAVSKQMEAITAIIAKERPFNGLTENLKKNLSTMGILFADLDKIRQEAIAKGLEPEDDMTKRAEQTNKRLRLLLDAAEDAYSMTWEQLKEKMQKEGLGDWASALEIDEQQKQAVLASLHSFYDEVQDAIKKESSLIKKQTEIAWNDAIIPGADGVNQSMKGVFEKAISQLGLEQGRVSRANSLIGAGQASERVADRIAIKQLKVQISMQQAYYDLIKKKGADRIAKLEKEAELLEKQGKIDEANIKRLDVKHAKTALALSDAEEQTKIMELQNQLSEKAEESQNRLYTELREWAELIASATKDLIDAYNAGNAEYYDELAKLNLTGKGGPGAGTYVVIDNAGTSKATAHYEYLDERAALERQHEIEQQNAQAEAWKKVMDDINQKMNDQITDWMNAMLQNQSIDANTAAVLANTAALTDLSGAMKGDKAGSALGNINLGGGTGGTGTGAGAMTGLTTGEIQEWKEALGDNPMEFWSEQSNLATQNMVENNEKIQKSTQSAFAKMTMAANLYGIAYQTMSNDNLSAAQKFQLFAVQAAGNAAIAMLTTNMATTEGDVATQLPGILGKAAAQLGPIAGPIAFAAMSALLGGLMGLAVSKITKSKQTIAQATGASVSAGRLSTGMLTYASGNVNELTDPNTLTPGRHYNVDGADGKTYRAKYTGKNPRTHITNGPEFHLAGEKGREAIIDAHTTRLMQMNDTGIWKSIQILYNGGSRGLSAVRRRGRGVKAFADGNLDDFAGYEEVTDGAGLGFDPVALQASLDRNSSVQEALLERLSQPIQAKFDVYGKGGLVDSYDTGKKNVTRHGEKY